MSRRSLDLALVCGLAALACGLAALAAPVGPLRMLAGALLALALPGYAVAAALFPSAATGRVERLALSGGLSLCIAIVCGLALHLTPLGLAPTGWGLALGGITLAASGVALARRRRLSAAEADAAALAWPALSAGQAGMLLAAGAVLLAALALGRSEAAIQPSADVLQLWILPAEPAAAESLRIGVISSGAAAGTFRLQLQRDGRIIREWPELRIEPGARWEATVEFGGAGLADGPIEGVLYPAGGPREPIRHVIYWPDADR